VRWPWRRRRPTAEEAMAVPNPRRARWRDANVVFRAARAAGRGVRQLTVPWDVGAIDRPHEVSVDTALRLGPVYAAGRLLAGTVAGLPLRQYRVAGETTTRMAQASLFSQPSVNGTLHDWLFRLITSLAYTGNAFGLITARDYLEYPTMIEWLDPRRVNVIDRMLWGRGSFTDPIWYVDGMEVSREDFVHIPYFSLPGRVWGLSPIGAFAATVRTGNAAQEYQADWFENGGVPPGTFKNVNREVDANDAKAIKDTVVQAIRSKKPLVFGRDWEYTPITVPAHEAKFIDTMRLNATQIAAIIGLPPELIGGETGGSMTYSSPEQRQIEFLQIYLLPWLTLIESHLSAILPRGQVVKFNADAMTRADILTRAQAAQIFRQIGAKNTDEIRQDEDMAPLPHGEGKDYTPLEVAVALARKTLGTAEVPELLPDVDPVGQVPSGTAAGHKAPPAVGAPAPAPTANGTKLPPPQPKRTADR
jgi:HK97 family phage portal protein